ncbi:MAG: LysR family transcriptional regulator [Deltaproteobacteria bacterium]|nr:LysR family transcriptional regulator [Deltaproteobacteria bacterium]
MHLRSTYRLENDQNEHVFGPGRFRILELIRDLGSMNKAAQQLGMSYRGLWSRIRLTEERLGFPLLLTESGRGSQLTPEGEDLLKKYSMLRNRCQAADDAVYQEIFGDLSFPGI